MPTSRQSPYWSGQSMEPEPGEAVTRLGAALGLPGRVRAGRGHAAHSPSHRIREVRICRYLVFWTSKKVKGPRKSVKAAWR